LIDQARALAGNVTPGDAPGFPVTISIPGSYQLSSDLNVPADTDAVVITSASVSLNLNGFSILGSGGSDGSGVRAEDGPVTVTNGTVRGMPRFGLSLSIARVERVTSIANGMTGIQVGPGSIVTGSLAIQNGLTGIAAGAGSLVTANTALGNAVDGISATDSTVSGNTTTSNSRNGVTASGSGTVNGNTVLDNDARGLSLAGPIGYSHNVLNGNAGGNVIGGVSLGQNLCGGVLC
jgi:hypothetical protein